MIGERSRFGVAGRGAVRLLLYYTRAVASRRTQGVRTCLLVVALVSTPLSARQDRVELAVIAKAGAGSSADVIRDSATRALALLDDWLGPLAIPKLTIIDAPWRAPIDGTVPPGTVVVRSRWHAPSRDRALDREVIAGITRQYWLPFSVDRRPWFREALALYTAGRAIDTLLERTQFHADRYLGGFLSHPIRGVSLSPIARDARPRLRQLKAKVDEVDATHPVAPPRAIAPWEASESWQATR